MQKRRARRARRDEVLVRNLAAEDPVAVCEDQSTVGEVDPPEAEHDREPGKQQDRHGIRQRPLASQARDFITNDWGRVRILILNWKDLAHPASGGAEVFTEEVARSLVGRGHSVTLLA